MRQIGLELAQHFVDQGPIFDYQQMRIENGRVFRADRLGDLLLHLKNLHPCLDQRGLETGDFVWNLRTIDPVTSNIFEIVADDMDRPTRNSRGNADAVKLEFPFYRRPSAEKISRKLIFVEARID